MPIEIEFTERRASPAKFMKFVGGQNGNLGRQHLGFSDFDRSLGGRFIRGIIQYPVDSAASAAQQRLGGVELDFEITDLRDRKNILVAVLLSAIDPRPDMLAYKRDRLLVAPRAIPASTAA